MNIFENYNYENNYYYSPTTFCNHFNKLMYLIINIDKMKNQYIFSDHTIYEIIEEHIKKNNNEINEKNSKGWTALMIAARCSNYNSNIETVKLLLDYGADINLFENQGRTVLMLAARYSNSCNNIETI